MSRQLLLLRSEIGVEAWGFLEIFNVDMYDLLTEHVKIEIIFIVPCRYRLR